MNTGFPNAADSASCTAVSAALCTVMGDRLSPRTVPGTTKTGKHYEKESESIYLPVYTQRSQTTTTPSLFQMRLQEGPLQLVAGGRAAPTPCETAPGFGIQAPDPIKMHRPSFILYPLSNGVAGGWQVTTKRFPQRRHSWSLSGRGGTRHFHHTQRLSLLEGTQRPSFRRHVEYVEYVLCSYLSSLQLF